MAKLFVAIPYARDFIDVYHSIEESASKAAMEFDLRRISDVASASLVIRSIYAAIRETDVVVADISNHHPSVMYEVGYAHALGKPVILMAQAEERIPFDIMGQRVILYDRNRLSADLVPKLAKALDAAAENPDIFIEKNQRDDDDRPPTAFVSYSHRDKKTLARLQVHMKPLQRESIVELWDDTQIIAGEQWKAAIESALNRAAIAVLLISADFLASEFIINNELQPLLAAAKDGGTTILPVILSPCGFTRDRELSRFQAINNPNESLLSLDEIQQEALWVKLVDRIEAALVARTK